MRKTPVDKLAQAGRLVLFGGSVLALLTLGAWTGRKVWIEDWDRSLVQAHVDDPAGRMEGAENIRGADPAASIALAQALMDDLAEVTPLDRLDPVVRRTLQGIILNHRRLDQTEEALETCEAWVEFDENNLRAWVELAELRLLLPAQRSAGLDLMQELFERTPQVGYLAGPWVAALMEEGRYLEAMGAAVKSDRLSLANSWTVSWMDGRPRKTTRRARLTPMRTGEDGIRMEFSLQGPVASMRVELPNGAPLTLVDPVLEISGVRQPIVLNFAESDVGLTRIVQSGNSFTQLDGSGAFFQVPLLHPIRSSQVDFVFRARQLRNPAEALSVLAHHSQYDAVVAALEAAGRTEQVETLRNARRRGLMTQKIQVYWRKEGAFSGQRSNTAILGGRFEDDRLHFETTLVVDAPATYLRIDFPEGLGTVFQLERIVTNVGRQREDVDIELDGLEIGLIKSIERDGAAFTVTGSDPHFEFEIPDKRGKVHELTVVGWAR